VVADRVWKWKSFRRLFLFVRKILCGCADSLFFSNKFVRRGMNGNYSTRFFFDSTQGMVRVEYFFVVAIPGFGTWCVQ